LPGGEQVLSMVKDRNNSANNALPSTTELKSAIDSQVTDKVNNLTTSASSQFSSVKDAVNAKLSVAEKAQLAAGLSSIATQGKKKIKLPTVATNTVDRSKITSSTKSLLGDSRIPEPDFTGEPNKSKDTNSTASTNSPTALASKLSSVNSEINKIKQQAAELSNLERNSLAGDPEIKRKKDEIQNKLTSLVDEKEQIEKDIKLSESQGIATGVGSNTIA
jgi:hypothetical protein